MSLFREPAPAKINLTLRVLGRRDDGYHALSSLVAFGHDIADTITLDTGSPESQITFTSQLPEIIDPELHRTNSLKDALQFFAGLPKPPKLGSVAVEKQIPLAAGLGGGSADAAALLRILQRQPGGHQTHIGWDDVARQLGADVPVCMLSRPQLMTGIGESTRILPDFPSLYAVLVKAPGKTPEDKTQSVFKALQAPPLATGGNAAAAGEPPALGTAADVVAYMRRTGNDLEEPARQLMPFIADPLASLRSLSDCLIAAMAGAGPTVFGVFESQALAVNAATKLKKSSQDWWVRATRLG